MTWLAQIIISIRIVILMIVGVILVDLTFKGRLNVFVWDQQVDSTLVGWYVVGLALVAVVSTYLMLRFNSFVTRILFGLVTGGSVLAVAGFAILQSLSVVDPEFRVVVLGVIVFSAAPSLSYLKGVADQFVVDQILNLPSGFELDQVKLAQLRTFVAGLDFNLFKSSAELTRFLTRYIESNPLYVGIPPVNWWLTTPGVCATLAGAILAGTIGWVAYNYCGAPTSCEVKYDSDKGLSVKVDELTFNLTDKVYQESVRQLVQEVRPDAFRAIIRQATSDLPRQPLTVDQLETVIERSVFQVVTQIKHKAIANLTQRFDPQEIQQQIVHDFATRNPRLIETIRDELLRSNDYESFTQTLIRAIAQEQGPRAMAAAREQLITDNSAAVLTGAREQLITRFKDEFHATFNTPETEIKITNRAASLMALQLSPGVREESINRLATSLTIPVVRGGVHRAATQAETKFGDMVAISLGSALDDRSERIVVAAEAARAYHESRGNFDQARYYRSLLECYQEIGSPF